MSQIVVRRGHRLPKAEVKRRAEALASRLRAEYGGTCAWVGDTLSFRGAGASGQLTVAGDRFEVRVDLGFLLGAFYSRIEREIHAYCDEQLGGGAARNRVPPPPSTRRTHGPSTSRRAI